MWGLLAVFAVITIILGKFIIARDLWRLLTLAAIWLVSFYILEIIVGLIIVNKAQFSNDETTPA